MNDKLLRSLLAIFNICTAFITFVLIAKLSSTLWLKSAITSASRCFQKPTRNSPWNIFFYCFSSFSRQTFETFVSDVTEKLKILRFISRRSSFFIIFLKRQFFLEIFVNDVTGNLIMCWQKILRISLKILKMSNLFLITFNLDFDEFQIF